MSSLRAPLPPLLVASLPSYPRIPYLFPTIATTAAIARQGSQFLERTTSGSSPRLWQLGEETKGNGGKSGRGNDGKATEERADGRGRGREGGGRGEERLTFLYRLNIVVSRKRSLCHEAIRKNPLFICASCRWHYGHHHSEKRGSSWIGMKSVCTV